MFLRQSTQTWIFVGPIMVPGSSPSLTPLTGLARTDSLWRLAKHNTSSLATLVIADDADFFDRGNGMYAIQLTAAQTDTVGRLEIAYRGSTNAGTGWRQVYTVLPQAIYDALVSGVGYLPTGSATFNTTTNEIDEIRV